MANTAFNALLILQKAVSEGASDVHFSSDLPTTIRVNGQLQVIEKSIPTNRQLEAWLETILDEDMSDRLEKEGDVDFAFSNDSQTRFRASAFTAQGEIAIAIRILNSNIPTFDQLALPQVMRSWSERETGLVIITGPTGSGKSTTLASLANAAIQSRPIHLVTIEDPIEFLLSPVGGTVQQREVGLDTTDFPRAVRAALREDVDVLVLGEMRDKETIASALTIAETGHLVFATLHTPSAPQAIDRIIDAFEPEEQPLIRSRLSGSLVGIAYQRLLKAKTSGRVAAYEILVANSAIRNLIREGKTHQIPSMMVTGMGEGMRTMESALRQLVQDGSIERDEAEKFLARNS